MICSSASMIAPLPGNKSSNELQCDSNGNGRPDVILEKDDSGNTYLHLVVPAAAVNFLNGSDGSSLFNFVGNKTSNTLGDFSNTEDDTDYDNVFVELGCKVYEINKVSYRGSDNRTEGSNMYNATI